MKGVTQARYFSMKEFMLIAATERNCGFVLDFSYLTISVPDKLDLLNWGVLTSWTTQQTAPELTSSPSCQKGNESSFGEENIGWKITWEKLLADYSTINLNPSDLAIAV